MRSASRRVCSRISAASRVWAIVPIDSTSESRKVACATSSPSATRCRRRSANSSQKAAAAPIAATVPARPIHASQALPIASPTIATAANKAPAAKAGAALIDDRVAKRNRNRVRPRVRLELRENVPHVALDGLLADEKPRGDVRVRHPVGEQLQDLALAAGEHLVPRVAEVRRHQCLIDEPVA